jgi:DNA-binding transcriptional ArsR family regulator
MMTVGKIPMPGNDLKFRWHDAILESALHDTTKLVGVTLWGYSDRNGEKAHPGVQNIAVRLNKSPRSVKQHLKVLRDEGWISLTLHASRPGVGRSQADEYSLTIPGLGATQVAPNHDSTGCNPRTDWVQNSDRLGATQVAPQQGVNNKKREQQGATPSSTAAALAASSQTSNTMSATNRRSQHATPFPASFSISADMRSWAAEHVPSVNYVDETREFIRYHNEHHSMRNDWMAAWRKWMLNVVQYRHEEIPAENRKHESAGWETKLGLEYDDWPD